MNSNLRSYSHYQLSYYWPAWLPYLTCPLLFFNFISHGKILKQKKEKITLSPEVELRFTMGEKMLKILL